MNSHTIIISIILVALSIIGIAIKILIQKNGKFSGTCASNSPFLNQNGEKCSYCGADPGEKCNKSEKPGEK